MKATINSNFGIKNCADCENNIRCEQCVYNKKSIEEVCKEVRKETAKEILQYLYEKIGNAPLSDIELVNYLAKQYGVNLEE